MTLPSPATPSRGLQILKTVLYILAGLVLALGLIAGISLITGAVNMAANVLLPLQLLGIEAISNLIIPMLSSFLVNLGVVTLILSLIISVLLYASGRLIGYIIHLEVRLASLEARQ